MIEQLQQLQQHQQEVLMGANQQAEAEAARAFARARELLALGNDLEALAHLEKALKLKDDPGWRSYLGYCIARERGQFRSGLDFCRSSMQEEPDNPVHYLNMGKIYLLTKEKEKAIQAFRDGLSRGPSDEIGNKLKEVGARKLPVLSFLPRNHPINKYLGLFLSRIGLR